MQIYPVDDVCSASVVTSIYEDTETLKAKLLIHRDTESVNYLGPKHAVFLAFEKASDTKKLTQMKDAGFREVGRYPGNDGYEIAIMIEGLSEEKKPRAKKARKRKAAKRRTTKTLTASAV